MACPVPLASLGSNCLGTGAEEHKWCQGCPETPKKNDEKYMGANRTDQTLGFIPVVVPHRAVAEVSNIGNVWERLVVVNRGWQSESADGPEGGWSCVF